MDIDGERAELLKDIRKGDKYLVNGRKVWIGRVEHSHRRARARPAPVLLMKRSS